MNNALNLIDFDTDSRPTGIKEAKNMSIDVILQIETIRVAAMLHL